MFILNLGVNIMTQDLIHIQKILLIIVIYTIVLLLIGPVIDHLFTPLDQEESNVQILGEIFMQLIVVTILWFYLSKYMFQLCHKYINIKEVVGIKHVINIISGLILIGLQNNLVDKLNYITHKHPFRYIQIVDEVVPKLGFH